MFEAFILGFWIIWSSGRNVRAVSEGLGLPYRHSRPSAFRVRYADDRHLLDGV